MNEQEQGKREMTFFESADYLLPEIKRAIDTSCGQNEPQDEPDLKTALLQQARECIKKGIRAYARKGEGMTMDTTCAKCPSENNIISEIDDAFRCLNIEIQREQELIRRITSVLESSNYGFNENEKALDTQPCLTTVTQALCFYKDMLQYSNKELEELITRISAQIGDIRILP